MAPGHQLVRVQRAGRRLRRGGGRLQQAGRRAATRSTTSGCPPTPTSSASCSSGAWPPRTTSIDLIGMDVIWTAEFAEAGWIQPVGGRRPRGGRGGTSSPGPLKTVRVPGQGLGDPVHQQHPAALVPQGPGRQAARGTWDEMIDEAGQGGQGRSRSRRASTRASPSGSTRWSPGAGGQIVDQNGDVTGGRQRQAGRGDREQARHLQGGAAGLSTNAEDQARQGFESGPLRLPGQLPVHLPERGRGRRGLPEEDRLGALPADGRGRAEPAAARRHQHRGVAPTRSKPDLAFEAAACLAQREAPGVAAEKGGLPPTTESRLRRRRRCKKAYPVRGPAARVDRGGRAAPGDARLQRHLARDPEDLPPAGRASTRTTSRSKLQDRIEKAAEGKIF